MMGTCPHCGIRLKEPPKNKRETNEVMLVIAYRKIIEAGLKLKDLAELGYCQLCKATLKDIEEQKNLLVKSK